MVQYLALAGANRFWEHVLLEPLLSKRSDSSKTSTVTDKKPQPDSPLHPVKADFIRKKYLFHGFFKLPSVIHPDDLNQQLHASVRTAVLETSLYLLALGANPNYIHPMKGTSPVHVACQYEQIGQLELLIAYGGDVCIRSDMGITPLEIALEKVQKSQQQQQQLDATLANDCPQSQPQTPWSPLIDCLVSAFYEVTDGLSFYLCRRVPNHKAAIFLPATALGSLKNGNVEVEEGQRASGGPFKAFYGPGHFLVAPKSVKESNGTLEGEADRQAEARAKVATLDNATFEDLCIDVYDEAERRLTNSFLEPTIEAPAPSGPAARPLPPSGSSGGGSVSGRPQSMAAMGSVSETTPSTTTTARPSSLILFFLPPNTAYTSVRNQARQKLGRLSMTAFRALVVDVLHEAAHRLVPLLESSSTIPLAVVRPKMRHHEYTTYGGTVDGTRVAVDNDDEVLLVVGGGNDGGGGVGHRATNKTSSMSVDDPVYDQVAVETEAGTVTRASVSTVPSISTTAVSTTVGATSIPTSTTPPTTPTLTMGVTSESLQMDQLQQCHEESEDQQQLVVSLGEESITSSAMNSVVSPSLLASTSSPSGVIESRPGNLPGSRRLHLAATGRLASYRASVPASSHCPSFGGMHKPLVTSTTTATTIPSSVTSTGSPCGGSLERCAAPTMLQQSQEVLVPAHASLQPPMVSVEVQTAALCCTMAVDAAVAETTAEVQRLQEEREKALQQVAALTARLCDLEIACERLTEENNALKAAFSAGMVKTHEATRSSPATGGYNNTSKTITNDTEHSDDQAKASAVSKTEASVEGDDSEGEDEEYNNEDVRRQSNSTSHRSGAGGGGGGGANGSGNYAVGSQCLDSGMLLRQGISLWARSSSPGDPVEVVATATTTVPSASAAAPTPSQLPSSTTGAVNNRSYVNLQNSRPSAARTPLGKQHQSPVSGGNAGASGGGLFTAYSIWVRDKRAMELSHKMNNPTKPPMTAPSTTGHWPFNFNYGFDSFFPFLSVLNFHVSSFDGTTQDVEGSDDYTAPNETGTPSPAPILPATGRASSGGPLLRSTPAHFAPAGVHRSGEAQLEYSVPPQTGGGGGHLKKTPPIAPVAATAAVAIASTWKHPPYERIVRGVECIIVRIRALLDAANGRRVHEQVRSSQLIQAAVQDLVVLFPPISKCHPTVAAALTSLMANSQKLRLHCEAIAVNVSTEPPGSGASSSNSSQLITFAHEIASAAKTILNFFQAERH
ncbi:ARF GTPase-activating protein GIT2 [Taenia solium]